VDPTCLWCYIVGRRPGRSPKLGRSEDTWTWDEAAAAAFEEVVEKGGRAAQAMLAFKPLLGQSDTRPYLSMMAPRLVELRRVLKPTGFIYLHCDPTASHYLKILMDSVFAPAELPQRDHLEAACPGRPLPSGTTTRSAFHFVVMRACRQRQTRMTPLPGGNS
jgi:hypothetical protein